MNLGQVIGAVVPIAGIVAAIIAGLVSWLGHHVSRKNAELSAEISEANAKLNARLQATVKLAEFRQIWINELRNDMSKFHSAASFAKFRDDLVEELLEIEARILLRLNPSDKQFNGLSISMYNLRTNRDKKKISECSNSYLSICQSILKIEWDVLKTELRMVNVE